MDWSEAICRLTAELDARGQRDIAADPTLTHDVTSYVLDGTDPRVLRRLAAAADGARLAMRSSVEGEHPARGLYDQFTTIPPEVLVRWGQALDAAGGSWTQSFHVGGADWPAALLGEVGHAYPHGELPFDFFDFAGLLASAEVNSGRLVVAAWATGRVRHYRHTHPEQVLARLRKYGAAVDQLHEWLAPLLIDGDTDHRLHAFEMLAPAPDDVLATYAAQVAASATGGSARIREVAVPLLDRIGATAVVHLRTLAVQAKPEQRRHALQLLWDAGDDEQRVFARATGLADRAASVRSVVDDFAGSGSAEAVPLPAVPEPEPVDWVVEWTGELAELLATVVAEVRGWHPADWRARPRNYTDAEVLGIFREQLTSAEPVVTPSFGRSHFFARSAVIRDGIARGVLGAPAIVKLLMSCDLLSDDYAGYAELRGAAGMLHACSGLTLLDLATLLGAVPTLDGVEIAAQAWFHDKGVGLGRDWEQDAVWPFFARHLDGVLAYWRQRRTGYSYGFDSEALFPLVASFPQPPTRLVDLCYELALGSAKSDRRAAQDHLATHPDAVRRAVEALTAGEGTVRAVAAEWLGRLGERAAVPDLAAAFASERNETVQGALLDALVALGEQLDTHFDLASVDPRAKQAMAKGLPAALRWLDPDRLPDVRRAGGVGSVPRSTMQWLTSRAVAATSPAPGALLLACVAQLCSGDASAFADRLLEQWVAADEQAAGRRGRDAMLAHTSQPGPSPGAAAKGLLALVAACGGAESVATATRYVRTWHGQRAAQSKALVVMLGHHRDPAAAAALVAIAYRFKAPSIERSAREEVAALAARRGWTLDQLSDRTVDTAGFDERGELALPYGDRAFVARLLPDCGVQLLDPDGTVLTTLPTPRKSDDLETARAARKSLAAAKKQLKETVATQSARLYDAMCVQRVWTGAEWHDMTDHPVLARLVGRLVWRGETGVGARPFTFRLLDDGTLTDAEDRTVDLPDDAEVVIAHDVTLGDALVASWQQHLEDYEIPPLFWQLGRGRSELTEDEAAATFIAAGGVAVPTGRLGQVTTRLGYRRGAVGDGAAYDWFEKEFASLGLRALLHVQGQPVWDHESATTLEGLAVESTSTGERLALGALPPVLLVELRHDLAVVAGP